MGYVILRVEEKLANKILASADDETREKIKVYNLRFFEDTNKNFLERYVNLLLQKIGVSMKLDGFEYLKRAIIILVEEPEKKERIYSYIAKEYNKSYANVNDCIRAARNKAYKNANPKLYEKIFRREYEKCKKMSQYEYLFNLVEYVNNNYANYYK